jgi:RimJ/RimL family protein N-acetyltransferase
MVALKTAPELTDGVIILRMMTLSDAEMHLANEDDVTARYFGGRSTIETSRAAIEEARLSWVSGGTWLNLGIWEAATGELVGYVDANLACPGYRPGVAANITYNVRPAVRGRGYAPRAVRLMLKHLAEKTTAKAAVIQFNPENCASARVAQKAGFKHLGERIHEDGNRMMVYGLQLRPGGSDLAISDVCVKDYESI